MRIPRIYTTSSLTGKEPIIISGQSAIHIIKVLRLRRGDKVYLFNGSGLECRALINTVEHHTVEFSILDCKEYDRESPLSIHLVQSISKGERMDWILQKGTELGASCFTPVYSKRSVTKLDSRRLQSRMERWNNIIIHACEQSGRNILPDIRPPVSLEAAIESVCSENRFFLTPEGGSRFNEVKSCSEMALFIGPEGGFDDSELQIMQNSGVIGICMGPRTLRTETAALAAITAIGTLHGDL